MKPSQLELTTYLRLKNSPFGEPVAEYRFHPVRKWRFDFAFPDEKIAIECEGAVWSRGRHTRGSGYVKDCEKYNTATVMGWRVLRYTTDNLDQMLPDLRSLTVCLKN